MHHPGYSDSRLGLGAKLVFIALTFTIRLSLFTSLHLILCLRHYSLITYVIETVVESTAAPNSTVNNNKHCHHSPHQQGFVSPFSNINCRIIDTLFVFVIVLYHFNHSFTQLRNLDYFIPDSISSIDCTQHLISVISLRLHSSYSLSVIRPYTLSK